jgi:hypothetical protein
MVQRYNLNGLSSEEHIEPGGPSSADHTLCDVSQASWLKEAMLNGKVRQESQQES